jgi:hypothetical protein
MRARLALILLLVSDDGLTPSLTVGLLFVVPSRSGYRLLFVVERLILFLDDELFAGVQSPRR